MTDIGVREPTTSPVCSVIIAAHNAGKTVAATVGSVLGQTFQDFEVIVVDDGSTDDTVSRLKQCGRNPRVSVYHQPHGGPSAARNFAIARAAGVYVSTIDSDDLWLPRYLELMVATLERARDAGFAYTDAWALDVTTGRFRRATVMSRCTVTEPPPDAKSFIAALARENFVYGSVTVRRAVLEEVGAFNPRLTHAEDYDLWLRIATAGYRGVRVAGPPLAIMRDRAGALHRDGEAMLTGKREALGALVRSGRLAPEAHTAAEAHLAAIDAQLDGSSGRRFWRLARAPVRQFLADATRGARTRWQSLSRPPADVAAVFPELGHGSRANGRPASDRIG